MQNVLNTCSALTLNLLNFFPGRTGNVCDVEMFANFAKSKKFANISHSVIFQVRQGTFLHNHRFRRFANIFTCKTSEIANSRKF